MIYSGWVPGTTAKTLSIGFLFLGLVSAQPPYDILIRNARVLDGTGNPWFRADVAISDETITAVGDLSGKSGRREINATGLYLAPGFVDVHSHSGSALTTRELSHARPLLAQGVSTVIINPDGGGRVDLERQRESLLEHGLGVHVAQMIPHGSVRRAVLGMSDRDPGEQELEHMRRLVRQGMEAGALGLSSGLYYAPGSYSRTEEVIELARVASFYNGVYASHIRDEADYNIGVVGAVEEVIRIAREAQLPGIVTHIKVLGPRVWGFSAALVSRIERARDEGVEVFADQYPYEASATSIAGALVPRWAQVGGRRELLARTEDPVQRARLREDILENLSRRGGAGRLQFRFHDADPSIEGKRLDQVAAERQLDPADLVIELLRSGGGGLVSFNMQAADVELLMGQEWTMTCSDGGLVEMGKGVPHPRNYGTFPRKIRRYVLEKEALTLAQAIRSMTSLPASVFGLRDRGLVRAGMAADLVLFDLERIRDMASYLEPHQLSQGVVYLLIAGRPAIDQGEFTGVLAGKVLRRGR